MDNNIIIYNDIDNKIKIDVILENETVWLPLIKLAKLFNRDKSVISRHIKNIYDDQELAKESTVAFFATVQEEGSRNIKRYKN
jgi:hypothetical protein